MDALLKLAVEMADGKIVAIVGVIMWLDMRGSFKAVAKDLSLLTVQMATIVERVDSHEKRIDKLEG